MTCEQCGASNPDSQKYCGACGTPLEPLARPTRAAIESTVRSEVAKALAGYVKDQRIAELDVTENVTNRLIGWGKVIGVILGVVLAGAGYLGFKSFQDVVDGIRSEVKPLVEDAKKSADELKKQIADAKNDVASLNKEKVALEANYAQMEKEAVPISEKLANLETDFKGQTSAVNDLKSQVSELDTRIRQLPNPTGVAPYHLRLEDVLPRTAAAPTSRGVRSLIFQATGDTGGVQNPSFQEKVAQALAAEFDSPDATKRPAFLYLLGNLIYYSGERSQYYSQFYHPYQNYPAPIFAIPGNHDGQNVPSETSLAGFMTNFCASSPSHRPDAQGASRTAMTQPNSFWTLETDAATIVGLYTNVPEDGAIDKDQQDWLVRELETAPMDKALILALHHPPFSFGPFENDVFHTSSPMLSAIEDAINKSHRVPNMVLSAHVNNYQRIDVELRPKLVVPFFIIGTGGYRNLRILTPRSESGANAGPRPPKHLQAGKSTLVAGFDDRYGFVRFEVGENEIKGRFMAFTKDSADAASSADEFAYSANAIVLGDGQTVSLSEGSATTRQ